tara:strand:- start:366 stop:530 length:165 start_codon:yes stop_codon:yes gene_type:complete
MGMVGYEMKMPAERERCRERKKDEEETFGNLCDREPLIIKIMLEPFKNLNSGHM